MSIDEKVLGMLEELSVKMDERFAGMDERLDGMDKRLDGMDKRFDKVEESLHGLHKSAMEQELRQGRMELDLIQMQEAMDRMERKQHVMEGIIVEGVAQVMGYQRLENRMTKIEKEQAEQGEILRKLIS